MTELRCKCNKLLAKINGAGEVEIKCPKCKRTNRFK
ncbi:TPA: Com family DNA-binding transcriptional regulator [Bacillus cereus]|nr:Com family DNA-binding transcriptional regulator [Bacillus cereus]HDR4686683.1 Com family DNA-binding transcriptional regulator [Bacillus cereus]HDR7176588.1 Com family DNA-binding transcriptional regulator [Bacillus cereus]HDR7975535.1 Com family DNA-binding transcriptional regulator [Bacillus cereus]HDU9006958.1 Com family DNA-binding transcriptional regulator [Bacillus cereus]